MRIFATLELYLKALIGAMTTFLAAALTMGPGSTKQAFSGFILGGLTAFALGSRRGNAFAALCGLPVGLCFLFLISMYRRIIHIGDVDPGRFLTIVFLFCTTYALVIGIVTGVAFGMEREYRSAMRMRPQPRSHMRIMFLNRLGNLSPGRRWALVVLLSALPIASTLVEPHDFAWFTPVDVLVVNGILLVAIVFGFLQGAYFGVVISPAFYLFEKIRPLLRSMAIPIWHIAVLYLGTVLIFATIYWYLYRISPINFFTFDDKRFGESLVLNFWDFVYFSLTTVTTVGLSDVKPHHANVLVQILVSLELVSGFFWLVLYFAIVVQALDLGTLANTPAAHRSRRAVPDWQGLTFESMDVQRVVSKHRSSRTSMSGATKIRSSGHRRPPK